MLFVKVDCNLNLTIITKNRKGRGKIMLTFQWLKTSRYTNNYVMLSDCYP